MPSHGPWERRADLSARLGVFARVKMIADISDLKLEAFQGLVGRTST
jgi:hypothetical protein